ncbi:hypothetical protein ACJIZ3_013787 [Penstemon smallii]|uniref:PRA1 family protein n=1 Tax=Penstemon smallii TaxID=265156 RepID=A0ABD3RIF3_9LAMI
MDRKIILGFLYLITLIAIFWTHVWFKIFLALFVGLPIVYFHAILRKPEDSLEDLRIGSLVNDLPNGPRGEYSTF